MIWEMELFWEVLFSPRMNNGIMLLVYLIRVWAGGLMGLSCTLMEEGENSFYQSKNHVSH